MLAYMALEESTFSVQTMKCKDSNERKDNTEHLTLNEILKMFDEKLEKFFKQYTPPRNSVVHEKSDVIIVKK